MPDGLSEDDEGSGRVCGRHAMPSTQMMLARRQEVCEKLRTVAAEADGGRRRISQLEAQLLEALNADTKTSPVDVRSCK